MTDRRFRIAVVGFFVATAAKFEIEPVKDFVLYGTVFQLLQFLLVDFVFGFIYRKA